MKYWVYVSDDDRSYGPFSFKRAVDFARIGSQHGKSYREVTRGADGPVVREYFGGKRTFPINHSQLAELTEREIPKELK